MKVGILSDTHGLLRPEVKEILRTCDAVLHGGDINSAAIVKELEAAGRDGFTSRLLWR